jgi:surfeit locus 1 family protein
MLSGLLTVAPKCTVCGLDFSFADTGDGPAMTIAGFIIVGLASYIIAYTRHIGCTPQSFALINDCMCWFVAPGKGTADRLAIFQQGGRRSTRAMKHGAKALLFPAIATALAFAILLSLGFWQLRRLTEKEALIAPVKSPVDKPPQALPGPEQWRALKPDDYDYRHIRLTGHFIANTYALIFAKAPDGFGNEPGFNVLTLFKTSSGGSLFSLIAASCQVQKPRPKRCKIFSEQDVELLGHLRAPQSRNAFTPNDTPERLIWFTRDPVAIAAALGLQDAAPFTLSLDPTEVARIDDQPRQTPVAPQFVNNHLSYAVTWFALAGALLVIFAMVARARLRQP